MSYGHTVRQTSTYFPQASDLKRCKPGLLGRTTSDTLGLRPVDISAPRLHLVDLGDGGHASSPLRDAAS